MTEALREKIDTISNRLHALRELSAKQTGDSLIVKNINNLNNEIDELESSVQKIHFSQKRIKTLSSGEDKSYFGKKTMQQDNKVAEYLRKGIMPLNSTDSYQISVPLSSAIDLGTSNTITDSVYNYLDNNGVIRQLASSFVTDKDNVELPYVPKFNPTDTNNTVVRAQWTDGSTPISTSSITDNLFQRKIITNYEMNMVTRTTQRMLDDVGMNIEEWLFQQIVKMCLYEEDNAFLNGTNATNKPEGILTNADLDKSVTFTSAGSDAATIAGAITAQNLLDLQGKLRDQYVGNSSFIMSRAVLHAIRGIKNSNTGQFLFSTNLMAPSLSVGTLFGSPVYTSGSFPTVNSAGAIAIAYGDFRAGYQVVDRTTINIQRDPYTSKGAVLFYICKRVGGAVMDANSIVLLRRA